MCPLVSFWFPIRGKGVYQFSLREETNNLTNCYPVTEIFVLHNSIALNELVIFPSVIYSGKNWNNLWTHIRVCFSSFRAQHAVSVPVCCKKLDLVDTSLSACYTRHLTAPLRLMGHIYQREVERPRSRCCLVQYAADEYLEPIFLLSVPMLAVDFLLSSAVAQPLT